MPTQHPWTPDPDVEPGTPPVNGTGGERGTSVFDGNADYNADYTPKAELPPDGPAAGRWYYSQQNPTELSSAPAPEEAKRESAGTPAKLTPTGTVTADDTTPAADTPVTLTAQFDSVADYPITGPVAFKDGATTLSTVALTDTVGGTVELSLAGLAAGAHSITAVYGGDEHYATFTTPALVVTAS